MINKIFIFLMSLFFCLQHSSAKDQNIDILIEEYKPVAGVVSVVFLAKVDKKLDGNYILGKMSCKFVRRWKFEENADKILFYIDKENKSFCRKDIYNKNKSEEKLELDKGQIPFNKVTTISLRNLISTQLSLSVKLVDSAQIKLLTVRGDSKHEEYVYIHLADDDLNKLKAAYPVVGFMPWYDKSL